MFLTHVSNWNVRAQQNASGNGVSLGFVPLVFQSPSAVLDFHSLLLYQQPTVLFRLKFLRMVPELLVICKEDWG